MRCVFKLLLLCFFYLNLLNSSIFLSWQFNRTSDYFYPFLYEQLDVSDHIDRYTPLNQFRKGYSDVGKQEHLRVFSELVDIIHNHGIGLKDIKYYDQQGEMVSSLLSDDEIEHLKELSVIFSTFSWIGLMSLAVIIVMVSLSLRGKFHIPRFKYPLIMKISAIFLVIMTLVIINFDRVFHLCHIIFFNDSRWMFSANESLLVILTKSPEFFAVSALLISVPGICLCLCFNFFLGYIKERY
jgi:uncharacterized membrane protein